MAIDTGLAVSCDDLRASGGIQEIAIREYEDTDAITFGTAHNITEYDTSGSSEDFWAVFEFKNETPALTITGTKENGTTSFEIGLTFTIPLIDGAKMLELQKLSDDKCLVAIVRTVNGENLVFGVSQRYAYETTLPNNQTFASLSGFEGGTGAAYSDENNMTVSLTCKQFELPRQYTGTFDANHTTLQASTT